MNIFRIGNKTTGVGYPAIIVAELSANHNGIFEKAKEIVKTACKCGVDAIKIQTYTADTMTLDSSKDWFQVKINDAWKGQTLYNLYKSAYTPWEWQAELKEIAEKQGVPLFSTAYDDSSVEFLEKLDIPVYKIASFEITDLELLKKVAQTKKPVIISRGMSSFDELDEAVRTLRQNGCQEIAILHCVSSYPAKPEEMNLATIPNIQERFKVISGLSDHTITTFTSEMGVVLGARIIEKHFTLNRADKGPDAAFSLEPKELEELVRVVRNPRTMEQLIKEIPDAQQVIGKVTYETGVCESENIIFRRALWVKKSIKKGEKFSNDNIGRFRPAANGLAIKFLPIILGRQAKKDIDFATPLTWDLVKD